MVSSPIFTIWLNGIKNSAPLLKTFQKLFSPGTTTPLTQAEERLNTTSIMCPNLRPSTTLTTSLHLNSKNELSTLYIYVCKRPLMTKFVKIYYSVILFLISLSAFFSRRETWAWLMPTSSLTSIWVLPS